MMTDVLEDLVDKELKKIIWQLCNGVTAGIDPISQSKLQTSDREDVVDCMVKQYPDDAGKIAVQALRNMKQNELAKRLDLKLQEGITLDCFKISYFLYRLYIYIVVIFLNNNDIRIHKMLLDYLNRYIFVNVNILCL